MNKAKAAASAVAHVVTDGDGDAVDRALISAKVLSRAQQLDGLQRRHYSKADTAHAGVQVRHAVRVREDEGGSCEPEPAD
jgi:hypothetical protein